MRDTPQMPLFCIGQAGRHQFWGFPKLQDCPGTPGRAGVPAAVGTPGSPGHRWCVRHEARRGLCGSSEEACKEAATVGSQHGQCKGLPWQVSELTRGGGGVHILRLYMGTVEGLGGMHLTAGNSQRFLARNTGARGSPGLQPMQSLPETNQGTPSSSPANEM